MSTCGVGLGRRRLGTTLMLCLLATRPGRAAPLPTAPVRIQLDEGVLQSIPGSEQAQLDRQEDRSPEAQALKDRAPPERAIPIIYIVYGILSIPVIVETVQEMLRRHYYGGVIIDARGDEIRIYHDKALPADMTLVIGRDGKSERYQGRNVSEDVLVKLLKK